MTSSSVPGPSAASSASSSAITGPSPSAHSGCCSSLHISDNQKRWVVVGIGMHTVLLPALLDVVHQEICQFYIWLKSSKAIDTQVFGAHMKNDGSFPFNYASINNNQKGKTPKMYDYKVTSAEDLGKLYLQPHMAKFTGFDNTCDLSAVLGILANASVFETSLQNNAKIVRSQVRNEWGHCNFDHWGELEYSNCFMLMKTLVSSLKLPAGDEKKILSDLLEWEDNGLKLIESPLNKDLVKLVSDKVANLEHWVCYCADEAEEISVALQNFKCEYDKFQEKQEEQNTLFSNAIGDMSTDISQLKSRHDDLEATVSCIKEKHDIHYATNSPKAVAFQVPSRNPYFCGRDSELGAITSHLKVTESGCAQSAVCGLGGVGKTSLAVEFLWRHKEEYKGGIFWISGESNTLFQNSFSELACKLETFVEKDFPSTVSKTLDWLQRQDQLWCLVVDNLDQPDLSQELRKLLRGKWKQQAHGHMIVTTRREARLAAEVAGIEERCCLVLDCFTEEDSIQFFRRRAEKTEGEDSEIHEIIKLLGALPLALDQAAAYIRSVRCSVNDYVKQYKKQKLHLLERKEARDVEENTSPQRSAVHATWLINFERIQSDPSYNESLRKATILVMEVSAFLNPDRIPFELINEGRPPIDDESGIADVLSEPLGRNEIISLLTEFSLFARTVEGNFFRVHRLVQEVIRGRLGKEREKFVLSCAERFLEAAFITPHSIGVQLALTLNSLYVEIHKLQKENDELQKGEVEIQKKVAEIQKKLEEGWKNLRLSRDELDEQLKFISWLFVEDGKNLMNNFSNH